ncbi:MAG: tRNA (adenosine(37)-N6)-threonylcarbamoyltransferase complex ATPase subunit type 1 TsaE [Bdellovibrionota bacterium]
MNSIKTKPLALDQIDSLAAMVAQHIQEGDVIALSGDLGAGKTTFVAQFVNHMKPEPEVSVSSPTYVIHHIYPAKMNIHHIDLYRLENPEAIDALGFEEFLGEKGVALIEWFEKFPKLWIGPTLHIQINISNAQTRIYEFNVTSTIPKHWDDLLAEIKNAYA